MPIESQQAAGLPPNPLMPSGPEPLVMEHFEGMNTVALRPGVPDQQCAWIDGFMPVAPRNLRTLYGIGAALYTVDPGVTLTGTPKSIVFYNFYNIGGDSFVAIFLSDGSVVQVNTLTGAKTTILAVGTIHLPDVTNCGTCQYGSTYLLIVAAQTDGYWIWDGSIVYTAGTLAPSVIITDVGNGYTSAPSAVITGGSGSGATVAATIKNGVVVSAAITNPGSGYLAGEQVFLTFSGGTTGGSGAVLTANMVPSGGGTGATFTVHTAFSLSVWRVTSVDVNTGGSGYSPYTTLYFFGPSSFFSSPVVHAVISGGVITSVVVDNGGGSTTSQVPSLAASDPGGAVVDSVTVNNGGASYSSNPVLTFTGGDVPTAQASATATVVGGAITSVTVTSQGFYRSTSPAPTIGVSDAPANATATIELMPFAISGTTVETYSGHVWIANGDVIYFSAPGSVSDFSTSGGGGNNTASDSFLRVRYTRLLNANGILWLFGDSSLGYISGVTTSGSPISTTFTIQNADPDTGTPWPASAGTFGRDVVFANSWGAHVGRGSLTTKTSDMLDGVYNSVIPATQTQTPLDFQPSAAKAIIFDRKIWVLLIPIINPITSVQENKLFLWDGKRWWASSQDTDLIYIASQEINSLLTAWGTDGVRLFPLFNKPSINFTKTVQSKLWDVGGYWFNKVETRFWAMFKYYSTTQSVTLVLENEDFPANTQTVDISPANTFGPTKITILPPTAVAQQGVLAGFTLTTSYADMAIISAALKPEIVQYRG